MNKSRFIYIIACLFLLNILNAVEDSNIYSIAVLPIYNLSYSDDQSELDTILDTFLQEIKKNKNYKLTDTKDTVRLLKSKRINVDTILLDDNLINIIKKLNVDFVMYNIISINENRSTTIYSKTINKEHHITTIEKSVRNKNDLKKFFDKTIKESAKLIEKETNIKVVSTTTEPSELLKSLTFNQKMGLLSIGAGGVLFTAGAAVLAYDTIFFFDEVRKKRDSYVNFDITYNEYLEYYAANIGIFVSAVFVMSLGLFATAVGIPYLFFIKSEPKVSLILDVDEKITMGIKYRFNINYQ